MKVVGYVNCYSLGHALVNCYVPGPSDQYSVLIFRISTVCDLISFELVCFQNSRYSVRSCSFLCPTLPLLLSFLYSKVEVENG